MPEIFKYMPSIKYAEMLVYLSRVKANTYFEKISKNFIKAAMVLITSTFYRY